MLTLLMAQFYGKISNTVIALLVLALIYGVLVAFIGRRVDQAKQKRRIQVRTFYIMAVVFLFVLARIWVEGFSHVLAVLGLVSAAIVVTNKESIMNLTGWLIIMWRGLFTEGDLIQVLTHKGYVKGLGVLYFTLEEVTLNEPLALSGSVIRVPNGLLINNPITNFSHISTLHLQTLRLDLKLRSGDFAPRIARIESAANQVIQAFYGDGGMTAPSPDKKRAFKRRAMNLSASVVTEPSIDESGVIRCELRYYCYPKDAEVLRQQMIAAVYPLDTSAEVFAQPVLAE